MKSRVFRPAPAVVPSRHALAAARGEGKPNWTLKVDVSGVRCEGEPPPPPAVALRMIAPAVRSRAQRSRGAARRSSSRDASGAREADDGDPPGEATIDRSGPIGSLPLLLTIREFAFLVGCWTEKSIRHRIARGQLPGVRRILGRVYLRRDEVLRFVLEGRGLSPNRSR